MTDPRPIRILHIVGGMNRGGVETWLMHVLRHIDRERYRMDFLVHTLEPCAYDDEIRALGSRIIPCLHPSRPLRYARNLRRVLRQYGPYDVVHSHVHHYSGFTLWLSRQAGVPMRIAHSHADFGPNDHNPPIARRCYLQITRRALDRATTHGLACSSTAAQYLYGVDWRADPRYSVLFYGIDLTPFHQARWSDPTSVRLELGLPLDALVIGHVGRLTLQKNHRFLLEVFNEIAHVEPKAHLLLVGGGQLAAEIQSQACALGLRDRVTFAGFRDDVPRLMMKAMDVFLFPSLYEGLGLVLVEAQAAGLPCVLSDVIPLEADVVPQLMHRVSLSRPASLWAEQVLATVASRTLPQVARLESVERSSFNIGASVGQLQQLYARAVSI